MKARAAEARLPWTVDSAGTGYWHTGELPDRRSIQVGKEHGIDITDQRARQFHPDDFDRFDRIFVMDTNNRRDVLMLAKSEEHRSKVSLMLDETHPGEERSVPDPYYDDNGFEAVYQMLDEACRRFIASSGH